MPAMTDEYADEIGEMDGAEMVRTGEYERADGRWLVFTSVGTPLLEMHVREDELVADPP